VEEREDDEQEEDEEDEDAAEDEDETADEQKRPQTPADSGLLTLLSGILLWFPFFTHYEYFVLNTTLCFKSTPILTYMHGF